MRGTSPLFRFDRDLVNRVHLRKRANSSEGASASVLPDRSKKCEATVARYRENGAGIRRECCSRAGRQLLDPLGLWQMSE